MLVTELFLIQSLIISDKIDAVKKKYLKRTRNVFKH